MSRLPNIKIFEYMEEGDFFVLTDEYQTIADQLELTEWNGVVWIGRLFSMDNDYGEHWFDNWDLRKEKEAAARRHGFQPDEIFVLDPQRFQDGEDGPCHTDELRKIFWTDVLKNLSLNLETLIRKAISEEATADEDLDAEFGIQKLPLTDRVNKVLKPYGKSMQDLFPGHEQADALFTEEQNQQFNNSTTQQFTNLTNK